MKPLTFYVIVQQTHDQSCVRVRKKCPKPVALFSPPHEAALFIRSSVQWMTAVTLSVWFACLEWWYRTCFIGAQINTCFYNTCICCHCCVKVRGGCGISQGQSAEVHSSYSVRNMQSYIGLCLLAYSSIEILLHCTVCSIGIITIKANCLLKRYSKF